MSFAGMSLVNRDTIEIATINYQVQVQLIHDFEKKVFDDLSQTFKPSLWQKWWKGITTFEEYIDNEQWWHTKFKTALRLELFELSEEQKEIYCNMTDRYGDMLYVSEYTQLDHLLNTKSDIYVSPKQAKFISIFENYLPLSLEE